MNIFAISGLVNGIVAITFGILVISKNWRDRANQIFFFMTLSLAVWSFSYWQWLLSTNYDSAILWVKILSVGSLFIPVFFYHWVILLINGKSLVNKIVLWLAYTTAIVILFFAQSNLFIAGLEKKSSFNFWPNPGSVYDVYFSYVYVGLITYTLYLLLRAYPKELDRNKKGQLLYVILGAILGFGGGLTNFPLWWNINIPPYGNFLVAAFPFLLGYSVLKYKLFNAKTITAELIAFALWVFTLIITFLAESTLLKLVYGFFSILMGIGGVFLIKAVYKTERLSEEKSEFISFAGHEVGNPLTFINGAVMNILEEMDEGKISGELKDDMQKVYVNSNEAISLIAQYLGKSKLELNQLKYEMADFDLKTIASQTIHNYQPIADQGGVSLKFTTGEDKDYIMNGDRVKIKEVLNNLVNNAIKFSPKGMVEVSLSKTDKTVLVEIKDSGRGISKETMSVLFKKFGRGDSVEKAKIAGTGLGLFLSKTFVEAHGGKIWAESEGEGRGSTFFVEFPAS